MSTVTRVKLGRRDRRAVRVATRLPEEATAPPVEVPARAPARGSVPLYLAAAAAGGLLMELVRFVWN